MSETLSELLDAARSSDFRVRVGAATALAQYDGPDVRAALIALLRDPADTAPIQAAADALVARRDGFGTAVICEAIGGAGDQDDDAIDHLLTFVAWAAERNEYAIYALAVEALHSDDPLVRAGAAELLPSDQRPSA